MMWLPTQHFNAKRKTLLCVVTKMTRKQDLCCPYTLSLVFNCNKIK